MSEGYPPQSRYNRFLGAANELPASELARALAANGRDTLTLLLTSTAGIVKRWSARPGWRFRARNAPANSACRLQTTGGVLASARPCFEEIERKAAADGIELLFGDTLRTNEGMIALARGRGFRLGPGFEARLVRIQKRLDDAAPDLPCRKWSEIAGGAELRAA